MCQISKIIQHGYSTVANLQRYGQMLQNFYSLFSLLSLHFFFSLLSHSPVPSLFSLYRFPLSSISLGCSSTAMTVRFATLDLTHTQPRSISPISPRGRCRSHPLPSPLCPPFTLPLSGCGGFFFLAAIWVDLMVVVGCGLWAMIVAVVVGCGGDGRWWLSVLLMIMGEGIIYYFNV